MYSLKYINITVEDLLTKGNEINLLLKTSIINLTDFINLIFS